METTKLTDAFLREYGRCGHRVRLRRLGVRRPIPLNVALERVYIDSTTIVLTENLDQDAHLGLWEDLWRDFREANEVAGLSKKRSPQDNYTTVIPILHSIVKRASMPKVPWERGSKFSVKVGATCIECQPHLECGDMCVEIDTNSATLNKYIAMGYRPHLWRLAAKDSYILSIDFDHLRVKWVPAARKASVTKFWKLRTKTLTDALKRDTFVRCQPMDRWCAPEWCEYYNECWREKI